MYRHLTSFLKSISTLLSSCSLRDGTINFIKYGSRILLLRVFTGALASRRILKRRMSIFQCQKCCQYLHSSNTMKYGTMIMKLLILCHEACKFYYIVRRGLLTTIFCKDPLWWLNPSSGTHTLILTYRSHTQSHSDFLASQNIFSKVGFICL